MAGNPPEPPVNAEQGCMCTGTTMRLHNHHEHRHWGLTHRATKLSQFSLKNWLCYPNSHNWSRHQCKSSTTSSNMGSDAVWFIAKTEVSYATTGSHIHMSQCCWCSMSALSQSPNLTADPLGLVMRRWAETRWAPCSSPSQLTHRQRPPVPAAQNYCQEHTPAVSSTWYTILYTI